MRWSSQCEHIAGIVMPSIVLQIAAAGSDIGVTNSSVLIQRVYNSIACIKYKQYT